MNPQYTMQQPLLDHDARLLGLALLDYLMVNASEDEFSGMPVVVDPSKVCADLSMTYTDYQTGLIWLEAHHLIEAYLGGGATSRRMH